MDWTPIVVAVIGVAMGSGGIIASLLNRRWIKQDRKAQEENKSQINAKDIENINKKLDDMGDTQNSIVRALKVSMAYDINCIGRSCVFAKEISLETKKTLKEMTAAYDDLPTKNGLVIHSIMDEIEKLQVVERMPKL